MKNAPIFFITPIVLGNSPSANGLNFMYAILMQTFLGPKQEGFKDGSVNYRGPEFREATLMIQELYDKGYINPDNASIPFFMDSLETFKAGKAGFTIGLASDVGHWKDFGEALGNDTVLDKMNGTTYPSYASFLPSGVENDVMALMYQYFISKEMSLDAYIDAAERIYRSSLQ
ncbi:MAG: hypothetical protein LBP93_01540 [Treponema sp.]|jgi:ABC-type glycerol-3-phosphate transport system substrate-binding protein|nr:hypothetical protein [Treponema sp.]